MDGFFVSFGLTRRSKPGGVWSSAEEGTIHMIVLSIFVTNIYIYIFNSDVAFI